MYHTPDPSQQSFARTNTQTIEQRTAQLQTLIPNVSAIGEICCGDFSAQDQQYRQLFQNLTYTGLDIDRAIVEQNKQRGLDCIHGDCLERSKMAHFSSYDCLFFGPPLSVNCDGHTLLPFHKVTPSYHAFLSLLFGTLAYDGTVVCIAPKSTTMGDVERLYKQAREIRPNLNLRLIYHSYATITGSGATTPPRLKYIELWFSTVLEDAWEIRKSEQQ